MVSTLDTWRGEEFEATRLSVYLESWRHYNSVPVCWSVCIVRMIPYYREVQLYNQQPYQVIPLIGFSSSVVGVLISVLLLCVVVLETYVLLVFQGIQQRVCAPQACDNSLVCRGSVFALEQRDRRSAHL